MISYFDAHCDTIWRCMTAAQDVAAEGNAEERQFFARCQSLRENSGHVDLLRGRTFDRYAQFFALYHDAANAPDDGMWAQCRRMHDWFVKAMAQNRDLVCHCRSGKEVDRAVECGKIAALLSIEGADLIDCDSHKICTVADWGVRFLNPVWNRANVLSGTNCDQPERGLSAEGKAFIRALECQGIYADVSHLSDAGFWDLLHMAQRPVIASHSNSRAICPHPRNLTDDQFRAIRDSGGVVGLNFYRDFAGGAAMDDLLRHVEHFLALNGEKTLCMGGDLDGCEALSGGMQGLEDVPQLYAALEKRGYSQELLEDLFWNNVRRLL